MTKNHLVLQVGGLVQQASPLLIGKRNLLKSPLKILWIDANYEDIS